MYTANQFVAHRGYTAHYPENTLRAVNEAIRAGAVNVEIDIQFSKDGIPMIYHDANLKRVSGLGGKLDTYTAVELVTMPAYEPERFGNTFIDIKISTAAEFVALVKLHPHVHFYIELKRQSIRARSASYCLKYLKELFQPVLGQCTLISFDMEAIKLAKTEFGFPSTGIVCMEWDERNKLIQASKANIAYINLERIPDNIAIEADCPLAVYEIADAELAAKTLERGAAKIESYAIGELIDALCKNNTM